MLVHQRYVMRSAAMQTIPAAALPHLPLRAIGMIYRPNELLFKDVLSKTSGRSASRGEGAASSAARCSSSRGRGESRAPLDRERGRPATLHEVVGLVELSSNRSMFRRTTNVFFHMFHQTTWPRQDQASR
jgi:hypothetical protein